MKRILGLSLITLIFFVGFGLENIEVNATSHNTEKQLIHNQSNISSYNTRWTWYYTDYTLTDGWYEKWYRSNVSYGYDTKVETYNAKGKLIRTRYY